MLLVPLSRFAFGFSIRHRKVHRTVTGAAVVLRWSVTNKKWLAFSLGAWENYGKVRKKGIAGAGEECCVNNANIWSHTDPAVSGWVVAGPRATTIAS